MRRYREVLRAPAAARLPGRIVPVEPRRGDLYELMEADPAIAHHFSQKLIARLTVLSGDLRKLDAQFAAVELAATMAAAA